MTDTPATKDDLDRKIDELKIWMLDREVKTIRWFVGTQFAYVVLTIGTMYFIAQHIK